MKRTTIWVAAGLFLLLECWLLADSAEAGWRRRHCGHHRRGFASCGGFNGGCNGGGCFGGGRACWGGRGHHRHAHNGYYGNGQCAPVAQPCAVPSTPSCCGAVSYGGAAQPGSGMYSPDGYVPGDPAPTPEPPMPPDEPSASSSAPSGAERSPSDAAPSGDPSGSSAPVGSSSGEDDAPPPPPPGQDTSDGLPPDA